MAPLPELVALAGIGTLATLVGLFGTRLAIVGSHEQLEPPLGWGGRVGIGSFESTRSRRLIWVAYGTIALLTGLAFFGMVAYTV